MRAAASGVRSTVSARAAYLLLLDVRDELCELPLRQE